VYNKGIIKVSLI